MSKSDTEIESHLPLTPAAFLILLVLADGPAHGYAMMGAVERITEGRTHLGSGTRHRTLQKLLEHELVAIVAPDEDERRVPYRITRLGAAVVRAEAERLAGLVQVARRRGLLTSTTHTRRGTPP